MSSLACSDRHLRRETPVKDTTGADKGTGMVASTDVRMYLWYYIEGPMVQSEYGEPGTSVYGMLKWGLGCRVTRCPRGHILDGQPNVGPLVRFSVCICSSAGSRLLLSLLVVSTGVDLSGESKRREKEPNISSHLSWATFRRNLFLRGTLGGHMDTRRENEYKCL